MPFALFVCDLDRLPTAESLSADWLEVEVATFQPNTDRPLTPHRIARADIIFVFEKAHRTKLLNDFRGFLNSRPVVWIDVPLDDLEQPELIKSLRQIARRNFRRRHWSTESHLTHIREPFEPRQRVIFFATDDVSGATVGRTAVIVRPLVRLPDKVEFYSWLYRVYDLAADEYFDASSVKLLASEGLQPLDDPPHPARTAPAARLLFESAPAADQDYLCGIYELPAGDWERFTFLKTDGVTESYRLSAPIVGPRMQAGVLRYAVPRATTLDEAFVRAAISRIRNIDLKSTL